MPWYFFPRSNTKTSSGKPTEMPIAKAIKRISQFLFILSNMFIYFLHTKLNSISSKPPTQKHHMRLQNPGDKFAKKEIILFIIRNIKIVLFPYPKWGIRWKKAIHRNTTFLASNSNPMKPDLLKLLLK